MLTRGACVMLAAAFVVAGAGPSSGESSGVVGFSRNDRVQSWQTRNQGDFRLAPTVGVRLENALSTSLNMATGAGVKDRWYDSVYNRAAISWRLNERTDVTVTMLEDWNRDSMARVGASLLTTDLGGTIRYRVWPGLTLTGGGGHLYDSRFENRDRGGRMVGGVSYAKPTGPFTVSLSSRGEKTYLKRRRDRAVVSGTVGYQHDWTTVSVDFRDDTSKRGYFSDVDRQGIEDRDSRTQALQFRVTHGDFEVFPVAVPVELSINLERKDVDDTANDNPLSSKYQNNASGLRKGIDLRIGGRIRRIVTQWGVEYAKNDNGVQNPQRQRVQTDVGMRGRLGFGIGAVDSVAAEGLIKRIRIDTPEGVASDRDELRVESGLTYMRYFSGTCKTALDFRVLETHYVNIDVSQAAQNKWLKTYVLSPSIVFAPHEAVQVRHEVNLYANYIDYDFDSDNAPRSTISRRVSSETYVETRVSDRLLISLAGMVESNDYGHLKNAGERIPAEEGVKRQGDVSLEYMATGWLVLRPVLSYSLRQDWALVRTSRTILRREIDRTAGLDCDLFKGENGSITAGVKRVYRTTERDDERIRNYATLSVKYGF